MSDGCVCGRIKVGNEVTESRNWNPDCPEHGLDSEWWSSPEQVAKREAQGGRLRDLQRQAREARANARREAER
jgi:hypothetical protein